MSAIEKRIEALALTLVTDMEACKYSVGKEAAAYLAIAAAEERGRREGIEERDKILDECVRVLDKIAGEIPRGRMWDIAQAVLVEARAALAPRDSGKEPAKMDAPGGPRCWCGRLSVSESGWCGGCESPTEPA